jgi:hypothetical protein
VPPVPPGTPASLPPPQPAPAASLARPVANLRRASYGAAEGTLPAPATGPVLVQGNGELPPISPWGDQPACEPGVCCTSAAPARRGGGFYASAEYLLWQFKDSHAPTLLTTGLAPGSAVLFNGDLDTEEHSGVRATVGYWLDCCQTNGIEASGFYLPERSLHFFAAGPVLARPFFDITTGTESAETPSFPGLARGSVRIDSPSQLWGAELDWRHNLCCDCWYRVDFLAGFRFVELQEGLHIEEDLVTLPGNMTFPPGANVVVMDRFDTRNDFYGGQVGFDTELRRGRWSLDLKTKVALGMVHEVVDIRGSETVNGVAQSPPGGLLALSSNIGHYSQNRFAVVPEVGLTLGYQVTDNVRVFAGYNFLFISNVVRPGEQVNTNINPKLIPPGNFPVGTMNTLVRQPAFEFRETSFFAHGITAGVEFKY